MTLVSFLVFPWVVLKRNPHNSQATISMLTSYARFHNPSSTPTLLCLSIWLGAHICGLCPRSYYRSVVLNAGLLTPTLWLSEPFFWLRWAKAAPRGSMYSGGPLSSGSSSSWICRWWGAAQELGRYFTKNTQNEVVSSVLFTITGLVSFPDVFMSSL